MGRLLAGVFPSISNKQSNYAFIVRAIYHKFSGMSIKKQGLMPLFFTLYHLRW